MSIDVMTQALEALESTSPLGFNMDADKRFYAAIAALRLAIEQAERQEPVAWADLLKEAEQIVRSKTLWKRFIDGTPLANDIAVWMADFAQTYTTPPQRQPLTDEEIATIDDDETIETMHDFARAVERKHGIGGGE